ncbi:MAG: radical SAM protein [Desulfobacterales bacterium]|jgi:radical SAM superfamily enzyme YgiQ (UPF0313 family)|nr:radical SAM protein [Desulfobacterales bacterium]
MKTTFVFPPFFLDGIYNLPPLGLINLATALNASGREVIIQDFVLDLRTKALAMDRHLYDRCAERILADGAGIIAFSAQCTTYPSVVQIAKRIKAKQPEAKIVIGGHNASFVDMATLNQFSWIDAVVRGEGEETLPELVGAYEKGECEAQILGVTWRQRGIATRNPDRPLINDLSSLPLPDYSLVAPLQTYRNACELPRSIAILEVGRGCPHQCVYCSESVLWRRRTRTFDVARLVMEMRILHEAYGAECFLLAYDQFTASKPFVESFCQTVIDERLNHLPWYCISRLDTVDAQTLRLMKAAGCESMCYGIDSGSSRTLAFIGKRIDEAILYQRVRETTDEGMVPTLSFVVGFPEEEKEDIDATLILALKTGIQGNSNPLMQMPTVLPGTGLYERYLSTLVRRVDTYFSLGIEFDNGGRIAEDEQMINASPEIFSSFYNLPSRAMSLDMLMQIAAFFPLVVTLYPKSFLLSALALNRSVSALFFEWMAWVNEKEGREKPLLTPADCFAHMTGFVTHRVAVSTVAKWNHLGQVVNYETCAIEAAKHHPASAVATVDRSGAKTWSPSRCEQLVIAGFTKNMPAIVSDLKNGDFRESYPDASGWLLFRQTGKELDVMEINDFGKDFLCLCDGASSLDDIIGKLYPLYGRELSTEAFSAVCRQTLEQLAEMNILSNENRVDPLSTVFV